MNKKRCQYSLVLLEQFMLSIGIVLSYGLACNPVRESTSTSAASFRIPDVWSHKKSWRIQRLHYIGYVFEQPMPMIVAG